MAVKDSVRSIPIASFNSALLSPVSWQAITSRDGIPQSCFLLIIKNCSNRSIEISYGDAQVHDYLPRMQGKTITSNSTLVLDFQNDPSSNNPTSLIRKGTVISLRGESKGKGAIYLSGYYQEELS